MNLVIDLGNTRAKLALFEDKVLKEQFSFEPRISLAQLQKLFKSFPGINKTIVSSVINHSKDISNFLSNHTQHILFDSNTRIPVQNKYGSPETLGKDRLAAAIGANSLYKGSTVLIIDAGTCIKTDVVTAKGEYMGGSISPGINMRFKALNQYTDKLPVLNLDKNYHSLTGNNTNESILSGVQNGVLYEVKGFIDGYLKQYPDLKIVLTGGDAAFFELEVKNHIFVCPELVLIGLNEIVEFNASK